MLKEREIYNSQTVRTQSSIVHAIIFYKDAEINVGTF